ncbi:MAG: iron-containing alcohol dehydrogenase [Muribaculaceae bacterium]|nr:iron-containing alcohol dehydrogenase [Muribaculaceae bacterium]
MENFTFYTPTRYVFGRGAENEVGRLSLENLGEKVLIVFGKGSVRRSGLLERVEASLTAAGVKWIEHGGVEPNPLDTLVYSGIDVCRREGVTGILAVGGGSAIDTAKGIAAGVLYEGDFWDYYCGKAKLEKALPVATVLTIPAAGSEGSGNSVITSTKGGIYRKLSIRTEALRPRFSLMNPELTFTLPPEQTAAGVADMMAHILERYFTPTKDVEITDRVAEGVLLAIIEEAPKVMADPRDYEARANIMWSSTLAHNGICGTGRVEDWVSHAMEHELSALYNVTHGAGLAVVFPAWMTYMAEHQPEKIAQFGRRVMGVAPTADLRADALEGIARLRKFFGSLGLPLTYKELGIDNPDIPTLVERLHANKGATIGGYMPLTHVETRAIYELMF